MGALSRGATLKAMQHIFLVIRQGFFFFFFLLNQSQRSRSLLQDGSRSLGLFWKGKIHIIAKLHRTDLVICGNSREGKTPSNSLINTVKPQF